jgi:hypothetical protein
MEKADKLNETHTIDLLTIKRKTLTAAEAWHYQRVVKGSANIAELQASAKVLANLNMEIPFGHRLAFTLRVARESMQNGRIGQFVDMLWPIETTKTLPPPSWDCSSAKLLSLALEFGAAEPGERDELLSELPTQLDIQWADAIVTDHFLTLLDNSGSTPAPLEEFLTTFLRKVGEFEEAGSAAEKLPEWLAVMFDQVVKTLRGIAALLFPTPGALESTEDHVNFVLCNTLAGEDNLESSQLRVRSSIVRRLKQLPQWVASSEDYIKALSTSGLHLESLQSLSDTAADVLESFEYQATSTSESTVEPRKKQFFIDLLGKLPPMIADLRLAEATGSLQLAPLPSASGFSVQHIAETCMSKLAFRTLEVSSAIVQTVIGDPCRHNLRAQFGRSI